MRENLLKDCGNHPGFAAFSYRRVTVVCGPIKYTQRHNMKFRTPALVSTAALVALTACVNPDAYPNDPNARTRNGALVGGMLGAVAGATSKGDDRLAKAVVGGALGAAIGGVVGSTLDAQAADLRNSIGNSNISVTNNGDYLVVNMPQDVLFATDSATLRPDLTSDIRAVAGSLMRYPNSTIEVIGHTDNTGSAAYNQDLSQRRAVSVAGVLQSAGVPGGRISAYGRGETQPVASNLNPSGRAQNRRVEIIIRPTT
jgi:outer membrane protein OmpA-like peptidoglycan-associated protein